MPSGTELNICSLRPVYFYFSGILFKSNTQLNSLKRLFDKIPLDILVDFAAMPDFKPLQDVLREFMDAHSRKIFPQKNVDNYLLTDTLRDEKRIQELAEQLKKMGHTEFQYIGNGANAVAFRTRSGEVLRLDVPKHHDVVRNPSQFMLQANHNITHPINTPNGVKTFSAEIVPHAESLHHLVERGAITREQAKGIYNRFIVEMAQKGFVSTDLVGIGGAMRLDNIGLKADGTPIVIDPGSNIRPYKPGANEFIDGMIDLDKRKKAIPDDVAKQKWNWEPANPPTVMSEIPPAHQTVGEKRPDASALLHDFKSKLGDAVGDVRPHTAANGAQGYLVDVPDTFSRQKFNELGINPAGLERQNAANGRSQIFVPTANLPEGMRRDAEFFKRVHEAGIPVSNAGRLADNGKVVGYTLDVPSTTSRQELAKLGIDVSAVDRINNGNIHRLTIPSAALPTDIRPPVAGLPTNAEIHARAKATIRGGVIPALVIATGVGIYSLTQGATPAQAAKASGHTLAEQAIPGSSDGFKDIRNDKARLADRIVDGLDAATGLGTAGSTLALAVPGAQPIAGPSALIFGGANVGVQVLRDITYITGAGDKKGIIGHVNDMIKDRNRNVDLFNVVDAAVKAKPDHPDAARFAELRSNRELLAQQAREHEQYNPNRLRRPGEKPIGEPPPLRTADGRVLTRYGDIKVELASQYTAAHGTYFHAVIDTAKQKPEVIAGVIQGSKEPLIPKPAGAQDRVVSEEQPTRPSQQEVSRQMGVNLTVVTDPNLSHAKLPPAQKLAQAPAQPVPKRADEPLPKAAPAQATV